MHDKNEKKSEVILAKKDNKVSKVMLNVDQVLLKVPHQLSSEKREIDTYFHIFTGPYKIKAEVNTNVFKLTDLHNDKKEIGIYNRES